MEDLFKLNVPLLWPALLLFVMGVLSLMFSLSLHLRLRTIQKISKGLQSNIFHKTFNVFNPYPDRRGMIHGSFIALLPILVTIAAFFITYLIITRMTGITGFSLSAILFIFCVALMTPEECLDVYENAGIFVRAIEGGIDLGEGDLTVLSVLKKTLPKLKIYYVLLSVMFFALLTMLRYILSPVILLSARFLGMLIELTAFSGAIAPFLAVFLLTIAIFVIQMLIGAVKRRAFAFPSTESLYSMNEPFEAMKQWVHWHHHELLHRPPPQPEERPDSEREKSS